MLCCYGDICVIVVSPLLCWNVVRSGGVVSVLNGWAIVIYRCDVEEFVGGFVGSSCVDDGVYFDIVLEFPVGVVSVYGRLVCEDG